MVMLERGLDSWKVPRPEAYRALWVAANWLRLSVSFQRRETCGIGTVKDVTGRMGAYLDVER